MTRVRAPERQRQLNNNFIKGGRFTEWYWLHRCNALVQHTCKVQSVMPLSHTCSVSTVSMHTHTAAAASAAPQAQPQAQRHGRGSREDGEAGGF